MIPVTQFILGNSDPLLYPSEDGKHLLEEQLKLVKLLKSKIVEVTNKEMELFKAFKEASKTNPNLTYEEFLNWFKDVDFDGDKVWEYFHMNN